MTQKTDVSSRLHLFFFLHFYFLQKTKNPNVQENHKLPETHKLETLCLPSGAWTLPDNLHDATCFPFGPASGGMAFLFEIANASDSIVSGVAFAFLLKKKGIIILAVE